MMKKYLLFLMTFLFSLPLLANPKTVIEVTEQPSAKQVKTAITILNEALGAIQREDQETYDRKILRARNYLRERQVQKTFAAEVMCGKRNAFDEGASTNCNFHMKENVCYKGDIQTTLSLIRHAIDYWNWDETWAENPRIKSRKLFVDIVDSPNDLRETIEIIACR